MKTPNPDLGALLEHLRMHRRVPAAVRARLLARAREIASRPEGELAEMPVVSLPSRRERGGWGLRIPFAATVCLVAAGAFASAAILTYRSGPSEPAFVPSSAAVRPVRPRPRAIEVPSPVEMQPAPPATAPHVRPATVRESYAAELQLLKHTQAAAARQDFSGALVSLAEHARRFPRGRLAEEREALRVRSLAGLGLKVDARRAGTAFARRFPHSALLPRVRAWVGMADAQN